eukprot:CAMPEP_0202970776 /NCGR_PEP_ID=MMETSP1396-20130829/20115_1 /ASSEMBLY_ACC=CAM_ASM_000872 /TAXON_ID= /ORGANISM="Pseudokeronopsis sp., Strain Brazil" /LENGTH=148 /DNA_ID=CAMNT_0049699519 /DNA_START=326 /DNA_END=772 /DNA_ORIENTATION=+
MTTSDSNFHYFTSDESYYAKVFYLYDDVCDKATAMSLDLYNTWPGGSSDPKGKTIYFAYSYLDTILAANENAASSAAYISTADYICAGTFRVVTIRPFKSISFNGYWLVDNDYFYWNSSGVWYTGDSMNGIALSATSVALVAGASLFF